MSFDIDATRDQPLAIRRPCECISCASRPVKSRIYMCVLIAGGGKVGMEGTVGGREGEPMNVAGHPLFIFLYANLQTIDVPSVSVSNRSPQPRFGSRTML